jgi:uncharacterized protein
MIERTISKSIQERLFGEKAIVILGPRQSGKTTLMMKILEQFPDIGRYFDCDELETRRLFSAENVSTLKSIIGNHSLILLDEAQKIANAGLTIKLIVDNLPEVQVIASGSSAFELSDKLSEPLTGRKWEYQLLPFSFQELSHHTSVLQEISALKLRLLFGSYPEVVNHPRAESEILGEICSSYLYKDVFQLHDIRKPELVENLLIALAHQVSAEVSFNELSQLLSSDPATIERYILLLERAFIIFRLTSYSTNQRNEIKRSRKIYFYDNGIRNALLADFRPIELRDDIGKLWENYIVSEFRKRNNNHRIQTRSHFWRSISSGEIDYLELKNAQFNAFEIKWSSRKKPRVKSFLNLYPEANVHIVNPDNYFQLLDKNPE